VTKDQGDEGSKWMEGETESIEPSKPDVFITGATPDKQLKNQVTYDYRTPKKYLSSSTLFTGGNPVFGQQKTTQGFIPL
jgi:hypothetical protein